jgi:hypothetical protein
MGVKIATLGVKIAKHCVRHKLVDATFIVENSIRSSTQDVCFIVVLTLFLAI